MAQLVGYEQGAVLAGDGEMANLAPLLDESVRLHVGQVPSIEVQSIGLVVCLRGLVDRLGTSVNCSGSYQTIAGHSGVRHSVVGQ